MAMSAATTAETAARMERVRATAEQPDMGAPADRCCLPSCGAALIETGEGTEGGVKLTSICTTHGTRGTQHLRARGLGVRYVPGHDPNRGRRHGSDRQHDTGS